MYKQTKNVLSGLFVALFGLWLYAANKTCCPTGVTIGLTISGIGFGYFCISLLKWDREKARLERIEELREKTEGENNQKQE